MRWLCLILLVVVACSDEPVPQAQNVAVVIDTGSERFVVRAEVADEPAEWSRGLMDRKELGEDEGMLFVFDEPKAHSFYMKNTLIPLDLLSIRNGRVVDVATMVPCEREPCPTTDTPVIDAALEVKAGTAKRAGIEPGALVDSPLLR